MHLILSDLHLGETHYAQELRTLLTELRERGTLVLAGDIVDSLRHGDATTKYAGWLAPEDVLLYGNHDPFLPDAYGDRLWLGDTFITHGDAVDFGLVAERLRAVRNGEIRGSFIERIVSRLRRWSSTDLLTYQYVLCDKLSDAEVAALSRPRAHPRQALRAAMRAAYWLWAMPPLPHRCWTTTPGADGERYAGYFTTDPQKVTRRLLAAFPEACRAQTLIIGHLHHAQDANVVVDGKNYRLITLGAWVNGEGTIALVREDGAVSVETRSLRS